jgi:hypothetical protein
MTKTGRELQQENRAEEKRKEIKKRKGINKNLHSLQ